MDWLDLLAVQGTLKSLLQHHSSKASILRSSAFFSFIDYVKAFDCVEHNKLWKILKEMGIPDHLTYLLSNIDSILKSREISLPTKAHLVKAIVFPVVMYGCEES